MTSRPDSMSEGPIPLNVPIIQRAFQLAGSGKFTKLQEIGRRLECEGYLDVREHLQDSRLLRKQLRTAVRRSANSAAPAPTEG